jgi:hypothetical protein
MTVSPIRNLSALSVKNLPALPAGNHCSSWAVEINKLSRSYHRLPYVFNQKTSKHKWNGFNKNLTLLRLFLCH